jgi:hypothetical protein
MSYLSILRNGEISSMGVENPIFIIESTPNEVIFEIFRSDAVTVHTRPQIGLCGEVGSVSV